MTVPSIRHRLVALVVSTTMRSKVAATDAEAADRLRSRRPRRDPRPPTRLDRSLHVTTDHSHGFPVHALAPRTAPRSPGGRPTVLYLHGGAYVADIAPAHWNVAAHLAHALDAVVQLPRYPLAPEHGWQDSRGALLELARADSHGRAPVLVGDSAGGGLALALAQARTAEQPPLPALVLISPWVDLALAQDTDALGAARDPWLDADSLRQSGRLWAHGDDPTRAELSPLNGDLTSLPPTLVLTGTRDVLHPQAIALGDAVRAAGGAVEFVSADGLLHVYPLLPIPEAAPALAHIVTFIARHSGGGTKR